jgi:methylated-DNA-[protein]-cysteine S-methyltransferase
MISHYDWLETPLGTLLASADEDGALVALKFVEASHLAGAAVRLEVEGARRNPACLAPVSAQLHNYFHGALRDFDLPIAPRGSAFQRRVWAALRTIKYGTTMSYGELARDLSSSPRAVGRANATNPIALVVPCHRVIGSGGALTGYAGGIARKAALLRLENGKTDQSRL